MIIVVARMLLFGNQDTSRTYRLRPNSERGVQGKVIATKIQGLLSTCRLASELDVGYPR